MASNWVCLIFLLFVFHQNQVISENVTKVEQVENMDLWKSLIYKFVSNSTENNKAVTKIQKQCYADLFALSELLKNRRDSEEEEISTELPDDEKDDNLIYDGVNFFKSWLNSTSRDLWTLDIFRIVSNDMRCRLDRPNVTSKSLGAPRYCIYETDHKSMDGILFGFCMPKSCDHGQTLLFGRISAEVLSDLEEGGHLYNLNEKIECSENKEKQYHWQFYATLGIFFVALVLVLAATFMDCPRHDFEGNKIPISAEKISKKFARIFSLQSNFRKLVHHNSETTLDVLHFVRTTATIFIVLSHVYFLMQIFAENIDEFRNDRSSFMLQLFYNGAYLPGSFFTVGGALQIYVTLTKFNGKPKNRRDKENEEKPRFSMITWICIIFNRYIRIVPLYLFCTTLLTHVLPYYNTYPVWEPGDPYVQCSGDIWRQMLFINNFKQNQLCMPWTWYLAVDFQLFLVFIPVVGLFVYRARYAVVFCLACLVAACTMRACLIMVNNYAPAVQLILPLSQYDDNFRRYSFEIYMKPYAWAASYVVGMLTGYLVYHLRYNRFIRLHSGIKCLLWIFSFFCLIWAPFGLYFNVNYEFKNTAYDSLYAAFNTSAWALAIGWITISCECYSESDIVRKFFRLRCWLILSNLTFGCYLLHLPFAFFLIYSYTLDKGGQPKIYISSKDMYGLFVCTLLVSYLVALCLYLLIEGPAANLQAHFLKLFFAHLRNRKNKQREENVSVRSKNKEFEEFMKVQQKDNVNGDGEPLFKYSNSSTVRF